MPQPMIYICYSQADEPEKNQLLAHLLVLRKQGRLDVWSEDQIIPGSTIEEKISQAVVRAKIAVLLVTVSFLNADDILDKIIPQLHSRRKQGELVIYPIIAKACAWDAIEWLKDIQVIPRDKQPVWGRSDSNVDEQLAEIAREIAGIVKSFSKEEQPSVSPSSKSASLSDKVLPKSMQKEDVTIQQHNVKGDPNMITLIGPMISKYAWGKATEYGEAVGRNALQKVWAEVFPPTPLYIAALEDAEKAVRQTWEKKGDLDSIPDLNIKEAFGDSSYIDTAKIQDMESISQKEIEEKLLERIGESEIARAFVTKVVNTANLKFKRSLAMDGAREEKLWKEYMQEVAQQTGKTQAETLARMAKFERMLLLLFNKLEDGQIASTAPQDSGSPGIVTAVDEMELVEEEAEVDVAVPADDIKTIARDEIKERYNDIYWDLKTVEGHKDILRPKRKTCLDMFVSLGGNLPENQKKECDMVKKQWEEIDEKIAQSRADMRAIRERVNELGGLD